MAQRRADKSGIHTWLVLMKAHRTLTRHASRSIEALDMCLSDFAILEALLHKGAQTVRELARRIDLTSGSMTTAIDRLETRHLVTRVDHATDRRAWVIHLTPNGETVTYLFEGSVRYEDTTGATGVLPAGGVEWFKAGHGAWHGGGSGDRGHSRGFQLWLALSPDEELAQVQNVYLSPDSVARDGPAR